MPDLMERKWRVDIAIRMKDAGVFISTTNFDNHRDAVILHLLADIRPKPVIVTNRGDPYFALMQPPIHERVEYSRAMSDSSAKPETVDDQRFVRMTEFKKHRSEIVQDILPVVVTWRGWPDFQVRDPLDFIDEDHGSVEYSKPYSRNLDED